MARSFLLLLLVYCMTPTPPSPMRAAPTPAVAATASILTQQHCSTDGELAREDLMVRIQLTNQSSQKVAVCRKCLFVSSVIPLRHNADDSYTELSPVTRHTYAAESVDKKPTAHPSAGFDVLQPGGTLNVDIQDVVFVAKPGTTVSGYLSDGVHRLRFVISTQALAESAYFTRPFKDRSLVWAPPELVTSPFSFSLDADRHLEDCDSP